MPKTKRTDKEISQVRKEILQSALEILVEDGFDKLTMRGLASRMNMTAANLYNYFHNKEELYVYLDLEGFNELFHLITESIKPHENDLEILKVCFKVYVDFGLKYPHRYDMMFNRFTPKSMDYVGTEIEQFAMKQVKRALKNWELTRALVANYMAKNLDMSEKDSNIITLRIWGELHGLISLYNSRILEEVKLGNYDGLNHDPKEIINEIVDQLILSLEKGNL